MTKTKKTKPKKNTVKAKSKKTGATKKQQVEQTGAVLQVDELELYTESRTAKRAGQTIKLSPREYRLLECLMRNAGQVVPRATLLKEVWKCDFDPETNVIDVGISHLRQKIDKDFTYPLLHTERGVGFTMHKDKSDI